MDIFSYFRDKGIDTVTPTYYRQIEIWRSWYNSRNFISTKYTVGTVLL